MRPPVVTDGTPKPVPSLERPASSRNGSTELKFGWLKALIMLMCHCTLKFSLTLTVLKNWRLQMFDQASRAAFRETLPNGVLNAVFAVGVFAMKRTSLLVTTVGV